MLYNWTLSKPESLNHLQPFYIYIWKYFYNLMHFVSFEKFSLENFSNISCNTSQSKQKFGSIRSPRMIIEKVHTKGIKTNLVKALCKINILNVLVRNNKVSINCTRTPFCGRCRVSGPMFRNEVKWPFLYKLKAV